MTDNLLDNEIPEKFKDPQTGELRTDTLLQSYKELERKMSTAPGAPKTPDEYCIDCSHGLFEPDLDINRRLHEKGLSNDQAQTVYDLAAEKMIPMLRDMRRDFEADREVEKLINHFGGPEQWKMVASQLMAFGVQNLPADVFENLSSSYEGVLALYSMMKSEEPLMKKENTQNPSAMGEKDLQSMMRDPKYWRDQDPAYVAKVTEGFKNMYGE